MAKIARKRATDGFVPDTISRIRLVKCQATQANAERRTQNAEIEIGIPIGRATDSMSGIRADDINIAIWHSQCITWIES